MGNFNSRKLILQRKLGLKEVITESAQWAAYTRNKDE
eukprot:CAMPEP_0185589248 /NCGR_PEP_ID=MMETSP0434-20130131/56180_1 /TAXON_ID=626734 ORGANISM="Favella taraikaensis, Strain Fe Narragansett Bay" /NCGR_SAMPLE_ID=MMETSP0434 /ASSEMBLY_ACC=CAM_ASM_000379 /LENGTH=36 /DNA_ID= /DNA_START= /DNA_END= /DNA_ORIENTATION=